MSQKSFLQLQRLPHTFPDCGFWSRPPESLAWEPLGLSVFQVPLKGMRSEGWPEGRRVVASHSQARQSCRSALVLAEHQTLPSPAPSWQLKMDLLGSLLRSVLLHTPSLRLSPSTLEGSCTRSGMRAVVYEDGTMRVVEEDVEMGPQISPNSGSGFKMGSPRSPDGCRTEGGKVQPLTDVTFWHVVSASLSHGFLIAETVTMTLIPLVTTLKILGGSKAQFVLHSLPLYHSTGTREHLRSALA